jgi:P-type Cu2+ transporter
VRVEGDKLHLTYTPNNTEARDRLIHRWTLPQDKAALIRKLKAEKPTAFMGDGINDAPALTEADLGLAIGAGTNVAIESADLVLVKSDPLDATYALKLAKATYNKMIQNLFWATGYNVIAMALLG